MKAVGIDLGTTNSIIAVVENGTARALNTEYGTPLLPSVVRYGKDGVLSVGTDARAELVNDPENTLASVKRLVEMTQVRNPSGGYGTVRETGDESVLRIRTSAGLCTPVEVSAEILKTLKSIAENDLDGGVPAQ